MSRTHTDKPPIADEDILLAYKILQDIKGGTSEGGEKLAKRILGKIEDGEDLTHPLIIFGESYYDSHLNNQNIRAENTPFNQGVIRGFQLDCSPNDIVGGTILSLGGAGLTASLECVWDPDDQLTMEEREGLKRHLRPSQDDGNPAALLSGILVLPKVALRATILE